MEKKEYIQIKLEDLQNLKKYREMYSNLKNIFSQKEKEQNEWKEKSLRLAAEFDNFRKRVEKEKEDIKKFSQGTIIMQLLFFDEIFEKAVDGIEKNISSHENIVSGLQMLKKEFTNFLLSLGVKKIETVGKVFDPNFHEAVASINDNNYPEGTIIEEVRPGYILENKLLRPAQVKVSSGNKKNSNTGKN
jgi:molecular chaperone GrpE